MTKAPEPFIPESHVEVTMTSVVNGVRYHRQFTMPLPEFNGWRGSALVSQMRHELFDPRSAIGKGGTK